MNQLKNNFGVGPADARALEERLVNMLSQTLDGRMNQVSRMTPGEAATIRILNQLGREDITEEQRFQFISDCRFGDIMSMQTILGLMEGQMKGGADYE